MTDQKKSAKGSDAAVVGDKHNITVISFCTDCYFDVIRLVQLMAIFFRGLA